MACNVLLPHEDNIPNKFRILKESRIQMRKPHQLPGWTKHASYYSAPVGERTHALPPSRLHSSSSWPRCTTALTTRRDGGEKRPRTVFASQDNVSGAVELRDVYFRYPSRPRVPVLRGLNIRIKAGETVALVGSSGCGKSTIVQMMQRFYEPWHGQVV